MDATLHAAIRHCRALHRMHGKSYYFATALFPKDLRDATYALYAFFRVPDNLVDAAHADVVQAEAALDAFQEGWQRAYQAKTSDDPVLHATQWVFHQYRIPFALSTDFLQAMRQDLHETRYATYEALRQYMWGSAAVVGHMMCYVIGMNDPRALPFAEKLGYAMQLTNFLRDIGEDVDDRGRIYLPADERAAFGVTDEVVQAHQMSPEFISFLQEQIARADRLYAEAEPGIALLHPRGRSAVRVASRLYQQILRKIEANQYRVFEGRVRTSFLEKCILALRALCIRNRSS